MTNRTLDATDRLFASLDLEDVLRAVRVAATEIADSAVITLWTVDEPLPDDGVVRKVARSRQALDTSSMHAMPILYQDALLGVLTCTGGDASEALTSLLDQAALAIRNAKLFKDSEARVHAAEALAEVTHGLTQSLEPALV